tara:strand:- start:1218 stop:1667 length:450 start_codon:yes stop_codon:yes gene_type:complete
MKRHKAYKGKFHPGNPKKYRGNVRNIIYRSMWERKLMVQLDRNEKVIEWGSEEIIIPYRSPLDGKVHRYFPDFYAKVIAYDGSIKKLIIEVKPKSQTRPPKSNPKRKTKAWAFAVKEYAKNQAKWESAVAFCEKNDMEFKIMTEDTLGY